jgi:hypothetical protein
MSQDRPVNLPGTDAQFTQITREAFNRYLRKASFYSDMLDLGQYTKGATLKYLTDAWECYILGLFDICAAQCGRAFEEHLAWKYFDCLRGHGRNSDEANKELSDMDLGDLIDGLRCFDELPKASQDCRIELIKHMRNYGSHAAKTIALKTVVSLRQRTAKGEILLQIAKQEVEYPEFFLELAALMGEEVDPKILGIAHLINDDSLFKLLETTVEIIRAFPTKDGSMTRFGPPP